MPLTSDLKIDASKFNQNAVSEETHAFNDKLIKIMEGGPKWYEVGAAKYRIMRENGETPLPKPVVIESGKDIKLPSRDKGREIPCRVFVPENGKAKGVFYHIHGGGWVLQNEKAQDPYLKYIADSCGLAVVSVGYRLAPEDPYPAGNQDCFDIAEYLVDNAEKDYGGPLLFLGGESAGGHLSAATCFELLETRKDFKFKGLVLNYGAYDLSGFLPAAWTFDLPLVLDVDIMIKFISPLHPPETLHTPLTKMFRYTDAYLPNMTREQKRDPKISPFFADLTKKKLPPAIFTCGTLDPLLDDSVLMSAKWMMSGAESVLKIYPGM